MEVNSIILCAGKGTRMKTKSPKVVQKILGQEMINHVLMNLNQAGITNNTLVVGYKKDEVIAATQDYECNYIEQKEQLGTGHAIKVCKPKFKNKKGITIISCGDTPLVSESTYKKLIKKHQKEKNALTILSAEVDDPKGYGRIIRNDVGSVEKIVEEKDASSLEKQVKEINSGIYCFNTELLFKYINKIDNKNAQKEYYLTDIVSIFLDKGERVSAFKSADPDEILGINDLRALEEATRVLQNRINQQHMLKGVKIISSDQTFIGPQVKIAPGVVIEPNNIIYGAAKIGKDTYLKQGNTLDGVSIGNNSLIGPNAHIHTGSKIGNNCKIGNYVEVKNSTIADNSKAAHLTYIGDSKVGKNVNIGCGVITANYDGKNKHQTIIGEGSFIGSNVTLIAPLKIKKNCLIAAGSTISINEIDENKLVIARAREVIKERKRGK